MVTAVKDNGKLKTTEEVLSEIYKAGETPTKANLLAGSLNTVLFTPGNPLLSKPWLHHYLKTHCSWIFASCQLIANSAATAGVNVIPRLTEQNPEVSKGTKKFISALEAFLNIANPEQDFIEIYRQLHDDLAHHGKTYVAFEFLEDKPPFHVPVAMYRIDYRTIKAVRRDEYMTHFSINDNSRFKNDIVCYVQEIIGNFKTFIEPKGKKEGEMANLYNAPWIFGNGDNVRYFYPEQILEIQLDSSDTSPLDCLEYSLATEIAAQLYTFSYFKNSTKTGIILSMEEGSREDATRNKETLTNEFANPDSSWKPMLLLGGMKLVRESANTSDVQYLEIRKFNREECCAAMGTPPSLLGQENSKGSDKEEDKLSFEEETVRPRSELILNKLTKFFYKLFPEQANLFEIVPGVKGRSSLHLMKIAQLALMCGGTVNESRKLLGQAEYREEPLADQPWTAANLMPVTMIKEMLESKKAGSDAYKDNNPGGQPRNETVQNGKTGRTNEQRAGESNEP
jgi:hypothetical protein